MCVCVYVCVCVCVYDVCVCVCGVCVCVCVFGVVVCGVYSVCKNFIEYFCIDIHKRDWSEVLFFGWVHMWFRYTIRVIVAS